MRPARDELVHRLRLYVVTDRALARGRSEREVVAAAIEGGATAVQLRGKDWDGLELYRVGTELREMTAREGVLFFVNDRVDIALAVRADGVHVGQRDIPAKVVRQIVGPDMIVGVSVENLEQAVRAEDEGAADYIGVGPVWATGTKPDAASPIGLNGLREICEKVNIPVVAIGGISHSNAGDVMAQGADGIAVVSAVVSADDIVGAARALARTVSSFQR